MSSSNEGRKRKESTKESQSSNKKHRGGENDNEDVDDDSINEHLDRDDGNGKPDGADKEDDPSENGNAAKLDASIAGIVLPPRQIDWTEEMWWTVDESSLVVFDTALALHPLPGALSLRERCEELYGWPPSTGRKVLKAYRQFLTLKKLFKDWDAEILDPSPLVDWMWKAHVLDTKNYIHDMLLLCGHPVHYSPTLDIEEETLVGRRRRKATYDGLVGYFGRDKIDMEIWGGISFDPEEPVTFKVTDSSNRPAIIKKIKLSAELGILFSSYAQNRQVDVDHVHLYYRGRNITKTDTPDSLGVRNSTDDVEITAIISHSQPIPTPMDCNPNEGFNIRVGEKSGPDLFFRIKPHTQMSKLFNRYAKIKGVRPTDLLF
mmetsp:Transcript_18328/g.44253  ORF Transcript_18328/g.44253 Transcript_18328/m.44253 type:complete len:375 (-) Transcript_18328:755-1879(-)